MTQPALDLETLLVAAEELAKDPTRFTPYEDDPIGFCRDILGTTLWKKQREVIEATIDHTRVAVRSGHGTGKSFVCANLVLWWLYARQGLVITTAPTWDHVETVLWREINMLSSRAKVPLPFYAENLTERKVTKEWYAVGLSTNKPSAFQGRHHARLLVVVDEAPGVDEQVHLEIKTLATGKKNCIVLIGNPTETSGTFFQAFKQPDIWRCIHISAFDHPNVIAGEELIPGAVTREWIDERRAEWGENHPFWYSRVLGEFPRISLRGVIPIGYVERAVDEKKRIEAIQRAETERLPRIGGLDVARYGDNKCVLYIRRGDAIEDKIVWSHASLMETAGRAMRAIQDYGLSSMVVDASGIGAGVVDRLLEQGQPVYAYNGGHRAFTPSSFSNRRSEMWWSLRDRFEKGKLWLLPKDHELTRDLIAPEYTLTSSGRIQVETKEMMLRRGVPSPDHADALALCFAQDEEPPPPPRPMVAHNQDPLAFGEYNEPRYGNADFPSLPTGF